MDKLNERYRMILLFSIYKNILSPKQLEYLSLYLEEDQGYSEIADIYGISRQAIFDNVSTGLKQLEKIESKLGIYEKYMKILDCVNSKKLISEIKQIMLETRENV